MSFSGNHTPHPTLHVNYVNYKVIYFSIRKNFKRTKSMRQTNLEQYMKRVLSPLTR